MAITNTSSISANYSAYDNTNKIAKEQNEAKSSSNSNRIDDIKDSYVSSDKSNSIGSNLAEKNNVNYTKKTYYGNTIGNVKLSDKAAEYYEQLKKKYSNLNFVLVSSAEKNSALAQATRFNNGYQITTVIDDEKIEKMATDPEYRKQMEEYIDNAVKKMNFLQNSLESEGLDKLVGGVSMQVNDDGTISYFAVLKDMAKAQKERIEAHLEKSREEKKDARNKEKLKAYEEQMKNKLSDEDGKDKNAEKPYEYGRGIWNSEAGSKIIQASSIEDLLTQIRASYAQA